jgi:transcriptional antiterminator
MEEALKDCSAKRLTLQRELDKINEEEKNLQDNVILYHGILDDMTRRLDNEIHVIEKGKETPIKEPNALQRSMVRAAKKLIAVDEKGIIIAEYKSQHEAALDLGVQYPTISWRVRKMNKNAQLKKFGYALIAG